jgi:hypothetical protein
MPDFEVRDGFKRVQFRGVLLAPSTTRTRRKSRWVELELYTHDPDPRYPGRYFLHVIGQSLVYHRPSGGCNTGVPTLCQDLPPNAVQCRECTPPPCAPGETVNLESARHRLHDCATPEEVIAALQDPQVTGSGLSTPAEHLLEVAAKADPGIAAALDVTEVILRVYA